MRLHRYITRFSMSTNAQVSRSLREHRYYKVYNQSVPTHERNNLLACTGLYTWFGEASNACGVPGFEDVGECCSNQTSRVIHKHSRTYETVAIHIIEDNCTRNLIQVYLRIVHSGTSTVTHIYTQVKSNTMNLHVTR